MEIENRNRIAERFSRFCAGVVLALVTLAAVYLFVMSMLQSADISTGSGYGEILRFVKDNLLLNLLALLAGTALLYGFWRLCGRISLKLLTALLLAWTMAAGLAFIASVRLQPSQDSEVVTFFAMQAARGDFSYFHNYYARFPYQFGYTLYEELLFRPIFRLAPGIPEGYACMLLQAGNLVLLCVTDLALIQCVGLLANSEQAQKMTALLLLLSLHGILFSTYLYGNIPGLAFSVLAVWMFLLHQRNRRWLAGILCGLFLTLGVILKLNYMIVLVALGIIWLLCLIRRWDWRSALCLLLCLAAVLSLKDMPQRIYERRMETDFGSGVPLVGWLALGMHEGQTEAGWYEATYTAQAFDNAGQDSKAAAQVAGAAVKERLAWFREHPSQAGDFFRRKFLSQWNEPSYETIWNNNVRGHFSEPGRLYTLLCRQGEDGLKLLMNFYQQLILFGMCAVLVLLWRRREIIQCVFPLIILGGVLYHILFEAKSQYAFSYFMLMIPLAAWGLTALYGKLQRH